MTHALTNMRFSDQRLQMFIGVAATGQLDKNPGFPGQILAVNVQFQPGRSFDVGKLYSIAYRYPGFTGATMNWQYSHKQVASDGTLHVFYEVV